MDDLQLYVIFASTASKVSNFLNLHYNAKTFIQVANQQNEQNY